MRKVLKFATGEDIPEGAIYLNSLTNGIMNNEDDSRFVWHYFLVEDSQ